MSVKAERLPSVWRLTSASLGGLKRHLKLWFLIVAMVAIPANAITLLLPGDATISTYVSLASILMNLALLWAVIQQECGHSANLRQAYYQGTASFVKFLLVSAGVIIELIPLALGLLLYSVGVIGAAPGTGLFEHIILAILSLVLMLPSFFLVNRSLLGLMAVIEDDITPLAALKLSWRRVKGRSWQTFGRLAGLVLVVTVLVLIPTLVFLFLYGRTGDRGWLAILQTLISLFILPVIDLYLYKLWRGLK